MNINIHQPTYQTWRSFRNRCNRVKTWNYSKYGGAGITYDVAWNSFEQFLSDMGKRPDGMTLDRIDNTKGYFKENCRWATPAQQQANRKNCMHLTHNGITKTSAEWSRDLCLAKGTVWNRIKRGWPVEKAVTFRKVGTAY